MVMQDTVRSACSFVKLSMVASLPAIVQISSSSGSPFPLVIWIIGSFPDGLFTPQSTVIGSPRRAPLTVSLLFHSIAAAKYRTQVPWLFLKNLTKDYKLDSLFEVLPSGSSSMTSVHSSVSGVNRREVEWCLTMLAPSLVQNHWEKAENQTFLSYV